MSRPFMKPLDPLDEPNKYYDPFIEREEDYHDES